MAATLAEKYDLPPEQIRFVEGLAQVERAQPSRWARWPRQMLAEGREPRALYEYWAPETQPLGQGGDMHFAFSFAAQAAEVEVNTRTGEVRVLRVIAANDVGTRDQPAGPAGPGRRRGDDGHGQRPDRGLHRRGRPGGHRPPGALPHPLHHADPGDHLHRGRTPVADGPYGAKGVGEIVSIPTTPAITNAIYNAVGVRVDRLPVDQEAILISAAHGCKPPEDKQADPASV